LLDGSFGAFTVIGKPFLLISRRAFNNFCQQARWYLFEMRTLYGRRCSSLRQSADVRCISKHHVQWNKSINYRKIVFGLYSLNFPMAPILITDDVTLIFFQCSKFGFALLIASWTLRYRPFWKVFPKNRRHGNCHHDPSDKIDDRIASNDTGLSPFGNALLCRFNVLFGVIPPTISFTTSQPLPFQPAKS
jgi:hypothetical protein